MDLVEELLSLSGLNEDVAYAGSREDYERPSLNKIGTGEGHQSHGWGLYYALNPLIAEEYRRFFTCGRYEQDPLIDGMPTQEFLGDLLNLDTKKFFNIIFNRYQSGTPEKFKDNLLAALSDVSTFYRDMFKAGRKSLFNPDKEPYHNPNDKRLAEEALKKREYVATLTPKDFKMTRNLGVVVKTEIPDLKFMLDEQEKINKQNEYIRSRISEIVSELDWDYTATSYYTGRTFYDVLSEKVGSDKEASKTLYKHGIMGIRYVGKMDGECVVVFNDKDVTILKKFYNGDGIGMERLHADG